MSACCQQFRQNTARTKLSALDLESAVRFPGQEGTVSLCHFTVGTCAGASDESPSIWQVTLNEEKENHRWTFLPHRQATMDDDAFRFGTLTQQVKARLRVSRFLSASMVVYLRFNCRF